MRSATARCSTRRRRRMCRSSSGASATSFSSSRCSRTCRSPTTSSTACTACPRDERQRRVVGDCRVVSHHRRARPPARPDLRRRTPARRAGSGARDRAGAPAARRAALGARSAHPVAHHRGPSPLERGTPDPGAVRDARASRGLCARRARRRARDGRVLATGSPHEVLDQPAHESLASLAGFENVFDGTVIDRRTPPGTMQCRLSADHAELEVPLSTAADRQPRCASRSGPATSWSPTRSRVD